MRAIVTVPPGERVAVVLLSVAVIPAGVRVVRVMVPLKPLMLVNVMVDVASHDPLATVRLEGLAVIVKSGAGALLLKVAV